MMHVVATAGHVDHGKSALVRALTGMEPDRWAEERRRGLTIDLGFAWSDLPSGATVAFVDVPGHERFISNTLAGLGPMRAVMFVVAANEGWCVQSAEHLAALHLMGARHGLLVVTKTDLAPPEAAETAALEQLSATSLRNVESVRVSAVTGLGLDQLRAALDRLVGRLPTPDPHAPVRLWIDRGFSIRGAGTVVTGTLTGGTIRVGDELVLAPRGVTAVVRGLQTLKTSVTEVAGVARVAVNLRHITAPEVPRGHALLTPGAWTVTGEADVRLAGRVPRHVLVHIGAAAVGARVRPLGEDVARLSFDRELPLHVGDRLLVRDPGTRSLCSASVLDPLPPPLLRRGAAAARARQLGAVPDAVALVRLRGLVRAGELRAMGLVPPYPPIAGDWIADPGHWAELRDRLARAVDEHASHRPEAPALTVDAARRQLELPDRQLVESLVAAPLILTAGTVARARTSVVLPDAIRTAVDTLLAELAAEPYAAPSTQRLAELRLDRRALALAAHAGLLLHVGNQVYLAPDAVECATSRLARLPQPFTVSQARVALATSRRVTVPLLEWLDRYGRTIRVDPTGRRQVI